MTVRRTGSRARRSSLSAVEHATIRVRHDGTYHGSHTEQLILAIDLPTPVPQLIVTIEDADSVGDLTNYPDPTPAVELAQLGEVLAQVLDFHEAFDLPREPLPTAHVGDILAQLRVRLLREEV